MSKTMEATFVKPARRIERRPAARAERRGTLSLVEHGRETTEQDIAWLNGLIAAERRTTETVTTESHPKRRTQRALRRKERAT